METREQALAEMFEDLDGAPTAEYEWLAGRQGITRATRAATLNFLLETARRVAGDAGMQAVVEAIGAATLRDEE